MIKKTAHWVSRYVSLLIGFLIVGLPSSLCATGFMGLVFYGATRYPQLWLIIFAIIAAQVASFYLIFRKNLLRIVLTVATIDAVLLAFGIYFSNWYNAIFTHFISLFLYTISFSLSWLYEYFLVACLFILFFAIDMLVGIVVTRIIWQNVAIKKIIKAVLIATVASHILFFTLLIGAMHISGVWAAMQDIRSFLPEVQ